MRALGVDWGERRIGLALGDVETGIASPLRTVINGGDAAAAAAIARIALQEGAEAIVIGYPKTLKGEAARMAHRIDEFAAELRDATEAVIALEDERLSSQLADRQRQAGASAGRDALAAAAILDAWLAKQR